MYNSSVDASIEMQLTRPEEYHGYVIDFQHKVDTDTIDAGGYFEVNFDNDTMYYDYNGITYATWWLKFKNNPENNFYSDIGPSDFFEMITDSGHVMSLTNLSSTIPFWTESFVNIEGYNDTLFNNTTGYTGEYQNWQQVHIELVYVLGVKMQDLQDTLNFRFHFESNALSSGKNGWAIKNIKTGYVGYGGFIDNNIDKNVIQTYPNPTSQFTTVKINNSKNKTVKINILSMQGKLIETIYKQDSNFTVDFSNYTKGIYIIEYFIEEENIGYSKVTKG